MRAGELLIELDATQTTADTTRIKEELESARAEALLVAIQDGQLRGEAPAHQNLTERLLLEGGWGGICEPSGADRGRDRAASRGVAKQ